MIDHNALDAFPPFRALPGPVRVRLSTRAVRRSFRAGETLWRAGDPSRGLWLLRQGAVDVVHSRGRHGRHDLLHREGPGGTMGEIPLLTGGGMLATGVAREGGECVILHMGDVGAAVRTHPTLSQWMMERLATRGHALAARFDRVRGSTVMGRLAAHLEDCHERSGGRPFRLRGRQVDLAEELGTAREVIVRYLGRLRRSGIIRPVGRGRLVVADRVGLAAMASPKGMDIRVER